MSEDYHLSDLDDAIIEETIYCCMCGFSMRLGGNDEVIVDGDKVKLVPDCNGVFCSGCAELVHRAYLAVCDEAGLCEHGDDDDLSCVPCREKYLHMKARWERKEKQ